MFGNRETIDESSSQMIDESCYDVIDDIKEEKSKGAHAGHLCDAGTSHERYDKWTGSTYNRTPRNTAYPSPTSQQTMQYPQPTQPMSAPAQKPTQMQSTVVNGRTYERPAAPNTPTPATAKATKAFVAFLVVGFLSMCSGTPITLILCIVMSFMILSSSAKEPQEEADARVNRMIAITIVLIIFSMIFSCTGLALFRNFGELFNELKET